MSKRKHDDDDWFPSVAELAAARPLRDIDPDLLAAAESNKLKRRGRPTNPQKKVPVSLRIEPNLLADIKATGVGWQTRVHDVLRDAFGKIH